MVPGRKASRRLNTVSAEASAVTAPVYWTMSKPSGLASVQTTRFFAWAAPAAHSARPGQGVEQRMEHGVLLVGPRRRGRRLSQVYSRLKGKVLTRRSSLTLPSTWFWLALRIM